MMFHVVALSTLSGRYMARQPEHKYTTVESVPVHVFENKECTVTPSPRLREYLRYMHDNHPHDLEYLWRHTQQYVKHGGCYVMTFEKWRARLNKDLIAQGNP